MAGNEETYKRILIKFVKTNTTIVDDIERALADRDFNLAGILAHSLKGSSVIWAPTMSTRRRWRWRKVFMQVRPTNSNHH